MYSDLSKRKRNAGFTKGNQFISPSVKCNENQHCKHAHRTRGVLKCMGIVGVLVVIGGVFLCVVALKGASDSSDEEGASACSVPRMNFERKMGMDKCKVETNRGGRHLVVEETRSDVGRDNSGSFGSRVEEVQVVGWAEWHYVACNGGAMVTKVDPPAEGDLMIPAELGGRPVVCIGERVFFRCGKLTSVKIPEGVTTIGVNAFRSCHAMKNIVMTAEGDF